MFPVNFRRITTQSGFSIVGSPIEGINSISLQMLGLAGSTYETKTQLGTAHFTEHLCIQSEPGITQLIANGGHFAASTSRYDVMYGFHVLPEEINNIFNIFVNLFTNASNGFINKEYLIEPTRNIIETEIQRYKKNPEKFLGRIKNTTIFADSNSRLNKLNTGDSNDIRKLNLADIAAFSKKYYRPENFVFSLAGNVTEETVSKLADMLGKIHLPKQAPPNTRITIDKNIYSKSVTISNLVEIKEYNNTDNHENNKTQQIGYISIDYKGYPINDKKKWELSIISNIIREQLKTIVLEKTDTNSFNTRGYGLLTINAMVNRNQKQQVIEKITQTIKDYGKGNISSNTFSKAKKSLITNLILNLEKPSLRASFIGELALHGEIDATPDTEICYIQNINTEDVEKELQNLAKQGAKITIVTC